MKKLNDEIQIKFRIVTGLWFDASRSYDAERSGGRVETWKRPKVLSALKENVKYPMLNFQYQMKEDNDEIQIKIAIVFTIVVWRFQVLRRWKVWW